MKKPFIANFTLTALIKQIILTYILALTLNPAFHIYTLKSLYSKFNNKPSGLQVFSWWKFMFNVLKTSLTQIETCNSNYQISLEWSSSQELRVFHILFTEHFWVNHAKMMPSAPAIIVLTEWAPPDSRAPQIWWSIVVMEL